MTTLALAPLFAVLVLAAAATAIWTQRRHQSRLVGTRYDAGEEIGVDILYFTGENCTICHVAQRPALERLAATRGDIVVREVDVAVEPELARRFRVMTLPTTIVLDGDQRVVALNTGFAAESRLADQVDSARAGLQIAIA